MQALLIITRRHELEAQDKELDLLLNRALPNGDALYVNLQIQPMLWMKRPNRQLSPRFLLKSVPDVEIQSKYWKSLDQQWQPVTCAWLHQNQLYNNKISKDEIGKFKKKPKKALTSRLSVILVEIDQQQVHLVAEVLDQT